MLASSDDVLAGLGDCRPGGETLPGFDLPGTGEEGSRPTPCHTGDAEAQGAVGRRGHATLKLGFRTASADPAGSTCSRWASLRLVVAASDTIFSLLVGDTFMLGKGAAPSTGPDVSPAS